MCFKAFYVLLQPQKLLCFIFIEEDIILKLAYLFRTKPPLLYKGLYKGIFLLFCSYLLSCSNTLEQYQPTAPNLPDTGDRIMADLLGDNTCSVPDLTNPYLNQKICLYKDPNSLNVEQKLSHLDYLNPLKKDTSLFIDMKNLSVANINMNTTYEELEDEFITGIRIEWKTDKNIPVEKQTPKTIAIDRNYPGKLLLQNSQEKFIGDSFTEQFKSSAGHFTDDKAREFINSLYQLWIDENSEDCLSLDNCLIQEEATRIVFILPQRALIFGNDNRRTLNVILMLSEATSIEGDDCFKGPFDLFQAHFICSGNIQKPDQVIQLGQTYQDIINQRSQALDDLETKTSPHYQEKDDFVQEIESAIIRWTSLGEKSDSIPLDSQLSSISLQHFFEPYIGYRARLLLMDHSLIKVKLKSDKTFEISTVPLEDPWQPQYWHESLLLNEEITKVLPNSFNGYNYEDTKTMSQDFFYLSSIIPEDLKDMMDQDLQKELLKTLFDFLVTNTNNTKSYQILKADPEENLVTGTLLLVPEDENRKSRFLNFRIHSGEVITLTMAEPSSSSLDDYLMKTIIDNKNTVDFKTNDPKKARELAGFKLGDTVYLKDKNIETNTAVVSFNDKMTEGTVTYSDNQVSKRYYPNNLENFVYLNVEAIVISSSFLNTQIKLELLPLQNGTTFDEYEIVGISVTGTEDLKALNLCNIEGINIESGQLKKEFLDLFNKEIKPVTIMPTGTGTDTTHTPKDPARCPYAVSDNQLTYFFSTFKTAIQFERENDSPLTAIKIYQPPSSRKENQ